MLKQHTTVFRRVMIGCDLFLVAASFAFIYQLQKTTHALYPVSDYMKLLPLLVVIWAVLLRLFGIYKSLRLSQSSEILLIVFKTSLIGFFVFTSVLYLLRWQFVSRSFIIGLFVASGIAVGLEKLVIIRTMRHMRRQGFNSRNILVFGTGKRAQQFISIVERRAEWGLRVIGLVDDDISKRDEVISGYRVLGSFDDLPEIIHNNIVDEVAVVVPRSWLHKVEESMRFCEAEGIKIHVAVNYFDLQWSKGQPNELDGFPLLTFGSGPESAWELLVKRFFDVTMAGLGLLLTVPFFVGLAVAVKLTSEGPIFFKQQRCGRNGRRFTLYKFRTMVCGAEEQLDELLSANEMSGPAFKMANDPRVTKIGRYLRRTSLDELPQLWNVLRGDMSLVGPRPPLPSEVIRYEHWQRRRLSMRPGITCLWQANGRNRVADFKEWVQLDLEYIDNWSLWLDCKILLKTIPAVMLGIGAK